MASRHKIDWAAPDTSREQTEQTRDCTDDLVQFGGHNSDGTDWSISRAEAIEWIRSGRYVFFLDADGRTIDVEVAMSRQGREYLDTPDAADALRRLPGRPEAQRHRGH